MLTTMPARNLTLVPLLVIAGCTNHLAAPATSEEAAVSDVRTVNQRADGTFDVTCTSGVREITTAAQIQAGQICNVVPSKPLDIQSMQFRADGSYDVLCLNGIHAIATSEQIRSGAVCSGSDS